LSIQNNGSVYEIPHPNSTANFRTSEAVGVSPVLSYLSAYINYPRISSSFSWRWSSSPNTISM